MTIPSFLVLVGFVAACILAAIPGAVLRPGAWYEHLAKPTWRPPNWLFAPIWSVMYLLIAVSGWLVWRQSASISGAWPLVAFLVQLVLNAAWTPIFFGLHRPDLALLEIVLVWLSIAMTLGLFLPVSVLAAALLVPYLAWITFAAALNFAVWDLNRPTLRE
jgi:translocator protein